MFSPMAVHILRAINRIHTVSEVPKEGEVLSRATRVGVGVGVCDDVERRKADGTAEVSACGH
jgi:hypothetical protein